MLSVHLCVQHVGCDAARRAGLSAIAESVAIALDGPLDRVVRCPDICFQTICPSPVNVPRPCRVLYAAGYNSLANFVLGY